VTGLKVVFYSLFVPVVMTSYLLAPPETRLQERKRIESGLATTDQTRKIFEKDVLFACEGTGCFTLFTRNRFLKQNYHSNSPIMTKETDVIALEKAVEDVVVSESPIASKSDPVIQNKARVVMEQLAALNKDFASEESSKTLEVVKNLPPSAVRWLLHECIKEKYTNTNLLIALVKQTTLDDACDLVVEASMAGRHDLLNLLVQDGKKEEGCPEPIKLWRALSLAHHVAPAFTKKALEAFDYKPFQTTLDRFRQFHNSCPLEKFQ